MKEPNALALLANYADICRDALKLLDPAERQKKVDTWFSRLPANQQQLINDFAPHAQAIAEKIKQRRAGR